MAKTLNLTLKVWRQENREAKGRIETYAAKDIPVDASMQPTLWHPEISRPWTICSRMGLDRAFSSDARSS